MFLFLSTSGLVFSSEIDDQNNMSNFTIVKELEDYEIVCLSGSFEHFIAVAKNGRVLGFGRNVCGELGLGNQDIIRDSFIEITTLSKHRIRAGYAGTCFSYFETQEGKILSCGHDNHGQLLKEKISDKDALWPTETLVNSGAKFCIAANVLGLVFIENPPPPKTPNMRITL